MYADVGKLCLFFHVHHNDSSPTALGVHHEDAYAPFHAPDQRVQRHRYQDRNSSGYIYVFTSPSRPGECKLGATTLSIKEQASEVVPVRPKACSEGDAGRSGGAAFVLNRQTQQLCDDTSLMASEAGSGHATICFRPGTEFWK